MLEEKLNYDLTRYIREEHRRAELARLDAGMEGCGCADCQEFYKTLDLAKYGRRVKNYAESYGGSFILISGVKAQKEKEDASVELEIILPPVVTTKRIMKQPVMSGRHRKEVAQEVSRSTKWRQTKRGQGILV